MEKQARGKTETRSGRWLQERKAASRRQTITTGTCASFPGQTAGQGGTRVLVGRGAGGHSEKMSLGIWGLPGHLGHHLATNNKGLAGGDDNRHGAHSQPQRCQDQRHFWQQTPKMLSAASVGL